MLTTLSIIDNMSWLSYYLFIIHVDLLIFSHTYSWLLMYIATNEVALHISAKKHVGGLNHHVIIVSDDSLLCLLWVVYYDQRLSSIMTSLRLLLWPMLVVYMVSVHFLRKERGHINSLLRLWYALCMRNLDYLFTAGKYIRRVRCDRLQGIPYPLRVKSYLLSHFW